jgi:hypothetical protein
MLRAFAEEIGEVVGGLAGQVDGGLVELTGEGGVEQFYPGADLLVVRAMG